MRVVEHPLRREFLDSKPSDGQEQRVLFLGSINQRKGISDALRAFSEVRIDGWTLHVIGAGTPEAESDMLKLSDHPRAAKPLETTIESWRPQTSSK